MSHLTPEEEDILRHHPHSPAADKVHAKRAPYTDGVNPVDDPAQKLTAARAYIAWEVGLVDQLDAQERGAFKLG